MPGLYLQVGYAGPDSQRFNFNAKISDDDLRLTYLPAWAALVKSGSLGGVRWREHAPFKKNVLCSIRFRSFVSSVRLFLDA